MTRFSLVLIIAYVGISASIVLAQEAEVENSGGTVRGKIIENKKNSTLENMVQDFARTLVQSHLDEYQDWIYVYVC